MERHKIYIDGNSNLVKIKDNSGKHVIIFVHGLFGSNEQTWGNTPTLLMTSPSFVQFDYGFFGYSSKLFNRAEPAEIAEMLRLWVRTNLGQYENIFFVAHSMGGLVVRHMIVNLLRNKEGHGIARRIRMCFMMASPVTGSPIAKLLSHIPLLNFVNRNVSYLSDPRIGKDKMDEAYKMGAEQFTSEGGSPEEVPHFRYFVGSNDLLVSAPHASFYKDYDFIEGIAPGDHSSLKQGLDENGVIINRVIQLIQETLNRSRSSQLARIEMIKKATVQREKAAVANNQPGIANRNPGKLVGRDVILISCSATKSTAAGSLYTYKDGIQQQLGDPRVSELIIQSRSRILRLVHEGKIDGIEFREGNRASKKSNRELLFGPDFGGVINEDRYLPAYLRYEGRSYRASRAEWERLVERRDPHILIMSGLYGLIPPTEFIQNYDVHLTDVDLGAGISIQSYWKDRELMTQILLSHLEWLEAERGPVGKVIDLLSELSYQETIQWSMVDQRWPVLHRVFEKEAGRSAIANMGIWLRDVIREPLVAQSIEKDKFFENANFITPDRIAFEDRIGISPLPVAREVNLE